MDRSGSAPASANRVIKFTGREDAGAPLLVLLHDDGSDERSMLHVGRGIWPGAPMLRPRGDIASGIGFRFLSCAKREPLRWEREGPRLAALEDDIVRTAREKEMPLVELVVIGVGGGADTALGMICRGRRSFAVALLYQPERRWAHVGPSVHEAFGLQVCLLADSRDPLAAEAVLCLQAAGAIVSRLNRLELPRRRTPLDAERRWLQAQLR